MERKKMLNGVLGKGIIFAAAVALLIIAWSGEALAIPTFQTYIQGATPGDSGQDQDTWFYTAGNTFSLSAVAAYGSISDSISNITLLISVPKGQQGTISIGGATLLTSTPWGSPPLGATQDILTNITGADGYSTLAFLPDKFNLHYPLQEDVSDFLIYDLGAFAKNSGLNNYDASTGEITSSPRALGQEKIYSVSFTGFSSLHFDLFGYYTDFTNEREKWEINPASHDATAAPVPEPGTLLLLGSGLAGLGLFGRRRLKGSKA